MLQIVPVGHLLAADAEVGIGLRQLPLVAFRGFFVLRLHRSNTLGKYDLEPALFTLHLALSDEKELIITTNISRCLLTESIGWARLTEDRLQVTLRQAD